ncbi:hypothetical protein [Sphingomonas sp. 3-13AW]|uniref:CYTH domain-containing protein n=1 Tax=Sphingomonas sp. 3-13AW TaxID=3050450 RepID=UPI003BB54ECF
MQHDREIERQFRLLRPAAIIIAEAISKGTLLTSYDIYQAYLPDTGDWTVRVRRTVSDGQTAPVHEQTFKRTVAGIERIELQTKLDPASYALIAQHCGATLHKRRSEILFEGRVWEVDVFLNPSLQGLELVEVEIPSAHTLVLQPDWVGEETSHQPQYRNAHLAKRIANEESP